MPRRRRLPICGRHFAPEVGSRCGHRRTGAGGMTRRPVISDHDEHHELPTARTTLRTSYVRVLVFCNSCHHQADGAIAGRAQLSTDPYPALWSATQIMREGLADPSGSRLYQPLGRWPSTLSIVMLSQVTHHSAIFPSSMRNIAPKSNCALRPEGGNGPIGPCCVPS